ncbi:hypothetical protein GALL_153130 [mine drainage metagenome]|uniref:Uncharacterized protein n=1 Tax=mine drainage metagenome TaxID=410659 RepID=A0A1J5S2X3_9ZZZZ
MKPRHVTIVETCPVCRADFSAVISGNPKTGATTRGKICPAGHWTPYAKLLASRTSQPSQKPPKDDVRTVLLKRLGAPRREDALQMALVTMVESYERALATLPRGSAARAMVDGAFGKSPEISRQVLELA